MIQQTNQLDPQVLPPSSGRRPGLARRRRAKFCPLSLSCFAVGCYSYGCCSCWARQKYRFLLLTNISLCAGSEEEEEEERTKMKESNYVGLNWALLWVVLLFASSLFLVFKWLNVVVGPAELAVVVFLQFKFSKAWANWRKSFLSLSLSRNRWDLLFFLFLLRFHFILFLIPNKEVAEREGA